jgi:hypothetical protein
MVLRKILDRREIVIARVRSATGIICHTTLYKVTMSSARTLLRTFAA